MPNSTWSWNVVEVKQENQPKWLQENRCKVHVKCLISPSSGCFHLTLASYHPCHVNRHHGWDDQLTPWAWPLRGRSTSCAAPPPPPGCSNILSAMSGKSPGSKSKCHQKDIPRSPWGDQQLCESYFLGKVFRVYWKLIKSCSQVQQQEKRSLQ